MNPHQDGSLPPDPEPEEAGSPIDLEPLIELPPVPSFLPRLRAKIGRRTLSAQVAGLGWSGPGLILLELLRFFFELFESKGNRRGGPQ